MNFSVLCMCRNILKLSLAGLLCLATVPLSFGALSKQGSRRCPCATEAQLAHSLAVYQNGSSLTLPRYYGIACDSHDLNLGIECTHPSVPRYCEAAWCFVDVERCTDNGFGDAVNSRNLPTVASTKFIGREFSYETCGSINTFSLHQLEQTLANSTVSAVVLSNTGGWRGSFCFDDTGCTGPTFSFVVEVLRRLKVNIDYVFKSTGSRYVDGISTWPSPEVLHQVRADNPSETSLFTMCAYATGMGYVDVCIGSFTITASRAKLSHFVEVYNEPAYLATHITFSKTTLWEYVVTPFRPFQPLLWLVLSLALLVVAWLMAWHERGPNGAFHDHRPCDAGASSVYEVLMSVFGGANTYQPTTPASRTTLLGMSFLIVIIISSYTANLASHLLAKAKPESHVQSMEQMISAKQKICMHFSLHEPFLALYPQASELVVDVKSRYLVLPAMDENQCEASLMLGEDFDVAADMCKHTLVGDAKFAVPRGIPVSSRFYRVLFNSMAELKAIGGWARAMSAGGLGRRLKMAGKGSATAAAADNADQIISECGSSNVDEGDGMPPQALIGPLAITFVLCVVGIVQRFTVKTIRKRVINPTEDSVHKIYEKLEAKLANALGDHLAKYHDVITKQLDRHYHHLTKGKEVEVPTENI